MTGLFMMSGCAPAEKQLQPWGSTVLDRIGFNFQDTDMDKGEVEGDLVLELDASLKPSGAVSYVVYWSGSARSSDKGATLTEVSIQNAKRVLYAVPQNTPVAGEYFLLFLKDKAGKEIFSGKSVAVVDEAEAAKEEAPQMKTVDTPQPEVAPVTPDASAAPDVAAGQPLVILIDNVLFEFDKTTLKEGYKADLKAKLGSLEGKDTVKLQISGHADERGSNEYNMALGSRRAFAVKRYLISLGFRAENINVSSYGEEQPVDRGHNEAAWEKNRRAETKVVE